MTHNEVRDHWMKELGIGLGVGALFGMTSVAVGQPLDTIKTKMQAQKGYIEKGGLMKTAHQIVRTEGLRGFYRGALPPLFGSGVFRSLQFAVFEGAYTMMEGTALEQEIPHTMGLQMRVLAAGAIAATSRAVVECPIEYIKTRRQTGQSWVLRHMFQGFNIVWARTLGLMGTYFILIDTIRRNAPETFNTPAGQFLASGVAATTCWWIVWPLELLKTQVQAGMSFGPGNDTIRARLRAMGAMHGGVRGMYRGILPGSLRSLIANGSSMVVMQWAQRKVTELGIRSTGSEQASGAEGEPARDEAAKDALDTAVKG